MNLDIQPPLDSKNLQAWKELSIINRTELFTVVEMFNPKYIVHLAATTTQNAKSLEEFTVNLEGTRNILEVANNLANLEKFIFTSSQYVNSPGSLLSENLREPKPYGHYGRSKLIGEELTQQILKNSPWIIIRPTTIWGPWHQILTDGLWKQIKKGRYFHPKDDKAIKAYGYVKNTAWQILRLLEIENELTKNGIFYLGDENISQSEWVNSFFEQLTNRKMRVVPKFFLLVASEFGELLTRAGINFPLYRSRYRNLITSNPTPLTATIELLGCSPISLEMAVKETVVWLNQQYRHSKQVN